MKIWPIITLVGLLYGASVSDSRNVGRESNPHPHRSMIDAEVAAGMKAFNPPHRPVTMAFREVFAKLLADQTEWAVPGAKTATAEATDDADDGQDPGKKLFWHSVFPDGQGVPFPGWGDPNPIPNPDTVSQPYTGPGWPDLVLITLEDDPSAPPRENENAATTASSHATFGNLPFGAFQAFVIASGGSMSAGGLTLTPCATALIDGVCPIPCTILTASLPACEQKSPDPVDIATPLGGLPTGSTPISAGGGSGSGIGGDIGGGVSVGNVPEPSTWALLGLGFAFLGLISWKRRKACPRASVAA